FSLSHFSRSFFVSPCFFILLIPLPPSSSLFPYTTLFRSARFMISDAVSPNRVRLIYDSVVKVEKEDKRVILENGEITYDYLVMALGFKSNTFGIKGMEENALSIVDIDSSREIRD